MPPSRRYTGAVPIYEYRCNACGRRVSVFQRSFSVEVAPTCDRCGSGDLSRLISRFAVMRADSTFADDFDRLPDFDEDDPRAVARWARRMAEEAGEDLGPEFEDAVSRMERGEIPEEFMDDEDDGLGDEDLD